MQRLFALFGTCLLLTSTKCSPDLIATPQGQGASQALSESEARKVLVDSAWAKRAKIHSAIKTQTPVPPMDAPGTKLGGLGPGGPGHGVVAPTADQIQNRTTGPQPMPCAGWGFGSMATPSPTSDECKAAWQSVSVVRSAGLPEGSVLVLWESAEPVREAKSSLAIGEAIGGRTQDAIVVSVIAHPLLREINPSGSMKQMVRDSAVLLRKGKDSVSASDVAFIDTNDSIVRFYFPRQGTVQPGDKELTFRFEIQDTVVEAKFSVKDMVFKGKAAL
jgi:hypothetical protein